jgi:two-component sensor histidine kinase
MMNRAGCLALYVPEDSEFGMSWLPLLPKEVHPAGREALRKAAAGDAARFPGKSISPEGAVYWDNLLTPLVDAAGQILSILCVSRDVTEKTLIELQLEEAVDREKLLAREMRHRIKNLFSVVSGLISISVREADSADSAEAAIEILREKLGALSRASDAVFSQENGGRGEADPVDLGTIVTSVMQPYGHRCTVSGTTVSISRDVIPTFALLLHELATNSVKYGALGKDDGNVTVHWMANDNSLDLTWIETGGPTISSPPKHRGFGTEMMDRIVRSVGGTINRAWRAEGLEADLHFPASRADEDRGPADQPAGP